MPKRSSDTARVSYPRYDREEVVRRLRTGTERLQARLQIVRVVLFGSYAVERHTAASDIDVLVVYEGASVEEAYAIVKKGIDLIGLEPHVYTAEEAAAMKDRLARMTRDGVVIYDAKTSSSE